MIYPARFRTFGMPCCGHILDWIGPRLPTFCPECGAEVFMQLKTGNYTILDDPEKDKKSPNPGKEKPDENDPRT